MPNISASAERETGHAGVSTGWGKEYFDDLEENLELRWPDSVRVYERMRRTNSKVGQTLKAITLPIRRTTYLIDPNGARDEIVARLAENVNLPIDGAEEADSPARRRQRGRFSFKEHWRHGLLSLVFGHMPFEQVYEIGDDGFARIHKLAPRMPHTIARIIVADDGGLEAIEQWPRGITPFGVTGSTGQSIRIGIDRLVWYAIDREGANWQGFSILRTAFFHYLLQERFYRVDAMNKERFGSGIPVVKRTALHLPSPEEESQALQFAKSYRAGEFAGGYLPAGFELEIMGITGTLPDSLESAKHHGDQIPSSMLAQFLNLGSTEYGPRALGEVFTESFYLALMAVVDDLLDVFNEHVIEDWVDLNWGEGEPAPRIRAQEIGQELTEEAIARLVEVGALKPDRGLRQHIRQTRRLPGEDDEDEAKEPSGQTYQYDLDYQIVTIDERRAQIGLPAMPNGQGEVPPLPPEARTTLAAANARRKTVFGLPPVASSTWARWRKPLRAAEGGRRREPFEHELLAQTDFDAVQGQWQDARDDLVRRWKELRGDQLDELMEQIEALVDQGDLDSLGALTITTGPGRDLVEEVMTNLAEQARDEALAEAARQGATIEVPDIDVELIAKRATATELLLTQDLATVAGRRALDNAGAGLSGADVTSRVRDHIEGLSDAYLEDNLGGALTAAQNDARLSVMGEEEGRFYSSELLDDATCDNCLDIDGKEYGSIDEVREDYPTGGYFDCLGGSRCRGTPVKVYEEMGV